MSRMMLPSAFLTSCNQLRTQFVCSGFGSTAAASQSHLLRAARQEYDRTQLGSRTDRDPRGRGTRRCWNSLMRERQEGDTTMKLKLIAYWATTAILAFVWLSGGVADLAGQRDTVA